jgi:CubicO group peptidase (beta-lactamase class C family)
MGARSRTSLVVCLALTSGCGDAPAAERRGESPATVAERPSLRATLDTVRLAQAYQRAAQMPLLRSLLVDWRGQLVGERYFNGARAENPANIKSASKSVISALVGIAIARGDIASVHQPVAQILTTEMRSLDTAKRAITIEDLLTMRSGLRSTSFGNYGAFVSSRNWVHHTLAQPMVAPRGTEMIYSTGSSHLLSAALTRATRQSTHAFGRRHLAPLGIRLRAWTTDPQGIYFGGNEMRMTPREMLAFGKLYLHGGRAPDGTQVLSRAWIDSSWVPRTSSGWSGHSYGYGWWIREAHGHPVYFAWGYGGQFIFVVPTLQLAVVATSDPTPTRREGSHLGAIHALVDEMIVPAVVE